MEHPLVSVVIPVWNGGKVIEACLDSVIGQDMTDMEIIVVDDGSTDDTWDILQRKMAQDGRIRCIRQENGGVSAARNRALPECRGEYIRFVDADDVLPPGAITALVTKAQDNGSDLVIAAYNEVVGPIRQERSLRQCEDTMACDEMLRHLNGWSNSFYYGVLWNKLFRREIIQEHKIEFISGLHWGEDFAFVCRYLTHAQRVSYTRAVVYDYQRNAGGMTVKQFVSCISNPITNCRMKWQLFQELKSLYVKRGQYPRYRWTLWLYLFRVTLSN